MLEGSGSGQEAVSVWPDPRLQDDPPVWAFAWRNAWVAARLDLAKALRIARDNYWRIQRPRVWR